MPIQVRSRETGNLIPLWYDEDSDELVMVSNDIHKVWDDVVEAIIKGRGDKVVCPNRDPGVRRNVKYEDSTYDWKIIGVELDEDGD